MTKREILESLARKITGDNTRKCSSVKAALHCIAEKAKGDKVECTSINDSLRCIDEHAENLIGGVSKLYCFGTDLQVVYTTKENPVIGDACYAGDYGDTDSNIRKYEVTEVTDTYIKANTQFSSVELPRNSVKDITF